MVMVVMMVIILVGKTRGLLFYCVTGHQQPQMQCCSRRCCLVAKSCLFCDPMHWSTPDSSVHGISQAQSTGVGCHFLLQGIFLTQGSNPHLLDWQADSLPVRPLELAKFPAFCTNS